MALPLYPAGVVTAADEEAADDMTDEAFPETPAEDPATEPPEEPPEEELEIISVFDKYQKVTYPASYVEA